MNVNLKSLVAKLDAAARSALESAAGLCLARTNYDVDIEHYLVKLVEAPGTDVAKILARFEVNPSRLSGDLAVSLDRLKTGSGRTPAISLRIAQLLEEAWLTASIDLGSARVRTGHILLALLASDDLARYARDLSRELALISVEALKKDLRSIIFGSSEDKEETESRAPAERDGIPGKTRALDQFTIDLTDRARKQQIDPVLGRDFEIRQVIDILTRRRQNNPILTGEAGVGKTAVVEGFSLRIVAGDVPPPLRNVSLRTLDLGLLQAGAGIKGEFENRLKSVIEEVKSSPQPIILFIDEAHTMIGAGGQAGQSDAANLLKPALARGELRTIAATTWAEYKKYFEKDAALARRFQVVKVEEPSEEQALVMIRGLTDTLERHHAVRILDEAVEDAVRLSHRYISGRQLPDKAVSVLDTACARVAIGQSAVPPAVEDSERRIAQLQTQTRILARESLTGPDHSPKIAELRQDRQAEEQRLSLLKQQWEKEGKLIGRIREVRSEVEAGAAQTGAGSEGGSSGSATAAVASDPRKLKAELEALYHELEGIQGESPLMHAAVTPQTVAEVISGWTGIPVGKMLSDEIATVLGLRERLAQRVVGQDSALDAISRRIRTSRANLTDPARPVGVFLLVGPSGVGKTETALTLADVLYGGERNLITINMSEYQEAHTVSSLKGSPPGYVGYGEGGVLTEAVRRRPYSVVLLDEVEKAHPDVMELFYQVFDKGVLEDGEGRVIDFKNAIILLTSNAGSDILMKLCADPETAPEPEGLVEALRPELLKVFKPALLGRMIVVPYYPISDAIMNEIVRLQLAKIGRRVKANHGAEFEIDGRLVSEIANRCKEVSSGARNVDHILTGTLLPEISAEVLSRMAAGTAISSIRVGVGDGGQFTYEIG